MEAEIRVVALDCDGVMFESREANKAYYNHLLDHLGMPPMTQDQLAYAHMHTVDEVLAHLIPEPKTRFAAHAYRKRVGYLPFLRYMEMEPGLIPLLETVRPRLKTAVATNRTDTMGRVLSDHGIDHLFDLVITAQDVQFPKPHPEALEKIIGHFDIAPEQMIYVGDSPVDEMAAAGAGVPFIAYRNPDLAADHHIENLLEIKQILGRYL